MHNNLFIQPEKKHKPDADFLNSLILFIFLLSIVIYGHYLNNNLLLIGGLFLMAIASIVIKLKWKVYFYIFLIPASNILKPSSDFFSFQSLLIFIIFLAIIFGKNLKIDKLYFSLCLFFFSYSLIFFNKATFGAYIETVGFILLFLSIGFIASYKEKYLINYETATIVFSFGVLLAGIFGLLLYKLPHMSDYFVTITMIDNLTRFTGLDRDPNFYGMYCLLSISLLSVVLIKGKSTKLALFLFFANLIFGFFTVSKMYLATSSLIVILMVLFMCRNLKMMAISSFITLLVLSITYFSGLYDSLFEGYHYRLSSITNVDQLTTGRSGIFEIYSNYLSDNMSSLLFGTGFFRTSKPFSQSTHNTFLSAIVSLGLVGTIIYGFIYIRLLKMLNIGKKVNFVLVIPIITFIIVLCSLELLFEDYFMIFIFIIMLGWRGYNNNYSSN